MTSSQSVVMFPNNSRQACNDMLSCLGLRFHSASVLVFARSSNPPEHPGPSARFLLCGNATSRVGSANSDCKHPTCERGLQTRMAQEVLWLQGFEDCNETWILQQITNCQLSQVGHTRSNSAQQLSSSHLSRDPSVQSPKVHRE